MQTNINRTKANKSAAIILSALLLGVVFVIFSPMLIKAQGNGRETNIPQCPGQETMAGVSCSGTGSNSNAARFACLQNCAALCSQWQAQRQVACDAIGKCKFETITYTAQCGPDPNDPCQPIVVRDEKGEIKEVKQVKLKNGQQCIWSGITSGCETSCTPRKNTQSTQQEK